MDKKRWSPLQYPKLKTVLLHVGVLGSWIMPNTESVLDEIKRLLYTIEVHWKLVHILGKVPAGRGNRCEWDKVKT